MTCVSVRLAGLVDCGLVFQGHDDILVLASNSLNLVGWVNLAVSMYVHEDAKDKECKGMLMPFHSPGNVGWHMEYCEIQN